MGIEMEPSTKLAEPITRSALNFCMYHTDLVKSPQEDLLWRKVVLLRLQPRQRDDRSSRPQEAWAIFPGIWLRRVRAEPGMSAKQTDESGRSKSVNRLALMRTIERTGSTGAAYCARLLAVCSHSS